MLFCLILIINCLVIIGYVLLFMYIFNLEYGLFLFVICFLRKFRGICEMIRLFKFMVMRFLRICNIVLLIKI